MQHHQVVEVDESIPAPFQYEEDVGILSKRGHAGAEPPGGLKTPGSGYYHKEQSDEYKKVITYSYAGDLNPSGYNACKEIENEKAQHASEIQAAHQDPGEINRMMYHVYREAGHGVGTRVILPDEENASAELKDVREMVRQEVMPTRTAPPLKPAVCKVNPTGHRLW